MKNRRKFLQELAVTATVPALLISRTFGEEKPPEKLKESDSIAIALGYKEDTTKVDQEKYPKHKPEQMCKNCVLYTGKADDAYGPCSAVGGKLVAAEGWCKVWAKKPEPAKE